MNMLALPIGHYLLAAFFILVCLLLMLVVLIQKGRGGGLSGAFGGVGGHSAFGAKTGDVFTWITVVLAVLFLVVAVVLNFVYVKLPTAVSAAQPPAATAGESGGGQTPAPAGEPGAETPPANAPAPTSAPGSG